MADPQKDKPAIKRLESAPGWKTRTAAPESPRPQAEPPKPRRAHEKPIWSSFSRPDIKMPTWPELKAGLKLDNLPTIKLPKINLPDWKRPDWKKPDWKMPAFSMPEFRMPPLNIPKASIPKVCLPKISLPKVSSKGIAITATATATFTLAALFAQQAGLNSDDTNQLVATPPTATTVAAAPQAGVTPPQAPAATAPATAPQADNAKGTKAQKAEQKQQKNENRLTALKDLPAPGTAGPEEINRLMAASKLPRDVIEEALHIYNHATPGDYRGRPEDKLEIIYSQGNDVLFARVHANKKAQDIYGFEDRNGNYGFYTEKGDRVDRSGMISPVDQFEIHSPRLSRVFNFYHHPIRRVRKHHDGIDFPVPRHTPVYAVSDGVLTQASRQGNYGKTVAIQHDGAFSSRYAHLDRYAKLKPGTRVQKGDIIGYVGSTGMSTGPHLHFEILKNGRAINPRTITAFSPATIGERDRAEFTKALTRMKDYLAGKPDAMAEEHARTHPGHLKKFKDMFHRPGDEKIKKLIIESAARKGIAPDLPYRLFIKEATVRGKLNEAARSDTGAAGLCQFTRQTFLGVMKKHGPALGLGEYADKIRFRVGSDKATYYTAGRATDQILALRDDKTVAIPLCTAYMRDNIDHLSRKLGRDPNFTDVAIAHFFGPGSAAEFIPAYDNPRLRKQYAYKFVNNDNLTGDTNLNVFFRDGNRQRPYTVEEVYNKKRSQMGLEPALLAEPTAKVTRHREVVLAQPR